MIPRILHRTIPANPSPQAEEFWQAWKRLHPTWLHLTWQDPIDPEGWETGRLWDRCVAGAQMAGMLRLELLWRYGGVYVDSDLEPTRPIDPLCNVTAFAGWEDAYCIPDFILAAEAGHPVIRACLDRVKRMDPKAGAWQTGPGVTTHIFKAHQRQKDVVVHPPIRFAPVHYTEKDQIATREHVWRNDPNTYAIHHWEASWK